MHRPGRVSDIVGYACALLSIVVRLQEVAMLNYWSAAVKLSLVSAVRSLSRNLFVQVVRSWIIWVCLLPFCSVLVRFL